MLRKILGIRPAFLLLPVLLAAVLLTGCPGPLDPDSGALPLPNGWYKGSALPPYDDGYGIAGNVLTHYNNGAQDIDFEGQVESYSGNVAVIKITTGSEWGPAEGKYYGVYIADVSPFSFTGSSAYKTDSNYNSGMDSLEAAIAEYTGANGYFAIKAGYGRYAGEATVTGINASLELSWAPVPGAAGYDLYYASNATPPTSGTAANTEGLTLTGTTAAITGLTNNTTYNVWVRAKNASRTGAWVYQGSGTPEKLSPDTGYFKGDTIPWDDGIGLTASHFYQYDDGGLGISYGGDIVKHIPTGTDGKAGIIIIKITEAGTWEKTVNNYYAVAYKNYGYSTSTETTNIRTSSAYKEGGENNGVSTIAQALTEYTAENGYFEIYGNYRKFRDEVPQANAGLTLTGLEGAWSGTDGDDADYFIRIANPVLTWSSDLGFNTASHQFAGTIVETTTSGAASGYIYIKVDFVNTKSGDYTDLEPGSYYAIHWKDKAGGGIKLCAAYGDDTGGTATLAEAKSEYTVDNEYFDDDYYVVITPSGP